MTMRFFKIFFMSLIVVSLAACGDDNDSYGDYIAQIEQALDSNRPDRALQLIDDHFASAAADSLTATQCARLSIAYMRLGDADDSVDNWEWAQRAGDMYGRALAADSVEAKRYYSAIPADREEYVQVMRSLYYAPRQHNDMSEQSSWDDCDPSLPTHDHQH